MNDEFVYFVNISTYIIKPVKIISETVDTYRLEIADDVDIHKSCDLFQHSINGETTTSLIFKDIIEAKSFVDTIIDNITKINESIFCRMQQLNGMSDDI